ncbi:GDSL-type esterase/lipase family protein [Actinomadura sp. NTSP31]|uniref:GDSL-type esterase/lipase family protein n=1 Tax=Actinomadura sp. NTSP31 TaxID=1735447 RepID=UPI0035BF509E
MRTTTRTITGWITTTATALAVAGLTPPAATAAGPASITSALGATATAPVADCPASRWVAAWTASPTDGSVPFDPSLGAVPTSLTDQTVRMVISPHVGGASLRLHLSNRFGNAPVAFGRVTVGLQEQGGPAVGDPRPVTFSGAESVTVPGGRDVVSDPVALTFSAFTPLSVSIYLPKSTTAVTKHWNANATSYYSDQGAGDLSTQTSGARFTNRTLSWLFVDGLDVMAPARAIAAFGDSITDGFVGGSPLSIPADRSAADKNGRYPDDLQRRATDAGRAISVVNAGIGSNQLLGSLGLMDGPSGLSRFQADALDIPGAGGIIVLEGINDLGLGSGVTPTQLQAGYTRLIGKAHASGKKIWLGTITPAANALIDGTATAPNSENYRQQVNAWIRGQALADGVIDFDAALRDPAHHSQLLPEYASPDNLHPSLRGYQKMADAVPLDLLEQVPCA